MTLTEKAIGVCFRRWALNEEYAAEYAFLGKRVAARDHREVARDIARQAVWVAWRRRYPYF